MTDDTPKHPRHMTAADAEDLIARANLLSDSLPGEVRLSTERTYELATQLSIAGALVAAIDRNTEELDRIATRIGQFLGSE